MECTDDTSKLLGWNCMTLLANVIIISFVIINFVLINFLPWFLFSFFVGASTGLYRSEERGMWHHGDTKSLVLVIPSSQLIII